MHWLLILMATITTPDAAHDRAERIARIEARLRRAEFDSSRSLSQYLGHVVIDSRPAPRRWGDCWEPWQGEIVAPMIPAIEQACGWRTGYTGPRNFLCVLPRGHDKTSLIGRLLNGAVAFAPQSIRATGAASTRDQAGLLLDSMKAEARLNPWLDRRLDQQNYVIKGPGGKLKIIAADAGGASGLHSDIIICDEITYWANRELFDMLRSGSHKRPQGVFIIITNAGIRDTWQHQLLQTAISQPQWWHVYQAPERQQMAGWLDAEQIAATRAELHPNFARRVIDNIWTNAKDDPLLSLEQIIQCQLADCLWPDGEVPRKHRPELYLGVDFGRTRNLTVITTGELVGDVVFCREIAEFHDMPFAQQEQEIADRIERYGNRLVRAVLDKGAQGWTTTENLESRFPAIVEGVHLSTGRQGQIAAEMRDRFSRQRIRIPDNANLRRDLQMVDRVDDRNGKPVIKTREEDGVHADRFWSIGLMVHGIPAGTMQKTTSAVPRGAKGRIG